MKGRFNFGKKADEKETSQHEKDLNAVEEHVNATLEKAKLLIHSEGFAHMRADYEEAEFQAINTLFKYAKEECDNEVFGKIARQLLMQLQFIRGFIITSTGNAGETYKGKEIK